MRTRIGLERLTSELRTCFRYSPPPGDRSGKERVLRMIERLQQCSRSDAGRLTDNLERHGYMYVTSARWRFNPHPLRRR